MLDDCFRPEDGTPLIPTDDIAALARAYLANDRAALEAVLSRYPEENAGSVFRQYQRDYKAIALVESIADFMALAPAAAGAGLKQFLVRRGIRPELAAAAQNAFNTAKLTGGISAIEGYAAGGPRGALEYGASGALTGALFSGARHIPYAGRLTGFGTFALFNLMQGDMKPQEAVATAAAQSLLYSTFSAGSGGPAMKSLKERIRARRRKNRPGILAIRSQIPATKPRIKTQRHLSPLLEAHAIPGRCPPHVERGPRHAGPQAAPQAARREPPLAACLLSCIESLPNRLYTRNSPDAASAS